MYELLKTQMDLLERILNFEESLQEPGRRNVTKGFLMDRLKIHSFILNGTLEEVLEVGIPGSLLLAAL